jgi:hypothetical protein
MGVNLINRCKDIILLELHRAVGEISDLGERLRSSALAEKNIRGERGDRAGCAPNCIDYDNIQVIERQRFTL